MLFPFASAFMEVDAELGGLSFPEILDRIVAAIPDVWLVSEPGFRRTEEQLAAYLATCIAACELDHSS